MKKLETVQLEMLAAGYCDPLIYALTGACTNAGCIAASVYNTIGGPLGLPEMYCLD